MYEIQISVPSVKTGWDINNTSNWWNLFFLKSSELFVWVSSFFPSPIYYEIFCFSFDKGRDQDLLRLGWFHPCWRQGLSSNFLTSLSFSENKTKLNKTTACLSCYYPYFPTLVTCLPVLYKEGNSLSSAELIFGALLPLLFVEYLLCASHFALAL